MNTDRDELTPEEEVELDEYFQQELEVDFMIGLEVFIKTLKRVLS